MFLRDATPLIFALLISLSVHIVVAPFFTTTEFVSPFAPPPNATHLETPMLEEQEVILGLEKSEAKTLTWIGYEQYQKHLARLSDVEQAAMELSASEPQPTIQEQVDEQLPPERGKLSEFVHTIAPITKSASEFINALQQLKFSFSSPAPKPSNHPAPKPPTESDEQDKPDVDPSDLEADATSIVEVPRENWKTGRPIATGGIVLRPRRPSFTAHQSVTNAPGGLTATLTIDRRGKPIQVHVLKGTGSASIDRSLVASLYKWRAAGDRIDALVEESTLNITIRISFTR
ncbi:MAG: hypothetical protein QGI78_02635 [Phycisphaerales bacterium]|jgi:hypothetical protein|nr:hypothetical protein [Phycisphaerales bacterium]